MNQKIPEDKILCRIDRFYGVISFGKYLPNKSLIKFPKKPSIILLEGFIMYRIYKQRNWIIVTHFMPGPRKRPYFFIYQYLGKILRIREIPKWYPCLSTAFNVLSCTERITKHLYKVNPLTPIVQKVIFKWLDKQSNAFYIDEQLPSYPLHSKIIKIYEKIFKVKIGQLPEDFENEVKTMTELRTILEAFCDLYESEIDNPFSLVYFILYYSRNTEINEDEKDEEIVSMQRKIIRFALKLDKLN